MGKLDGKVALISGGARGQGAAEAETFVKEGARVVFGDIRDDEGKKVEAAIRAAGHDATYLHLVVNWLEIAATSEFIGRERAVAVAAAQRSYRWLYRTVLKDWDALGEIYERHDIVPMQHADTLRKDASKLDKPALNGVARKTPAAAAPSALPRSRRRSQARGGTRAG